MIENIWLRTGPYHRHIFADPSKHVFDAPRRTRGASRHPHGLVIEALRAGRQADVPRAIEADILSGDAIILQHLPEDPPGRLKSLTRSLPGLKELPSKFLGGATAVAPASRGTEPRSPRKRSRPGVATRRA